MTEALNVPTRRIFVITVATGVALATAHVVAGAENYSDRRGDGRGAPDIYGIYVADGGEPARLTLGPSVSTTSGYLLLDLDVDINARTGSPAGSDYRIELDFGGKRTRFYKWRGSNFVRYSPAEVFVIVSSPYMSIPAAEVGNPTRFRFWLRSERRSGSKVTAFDRAPNTGAWTYSLRIAEAGAFVLGDPEPGASGIHAGKPFTVIASANKDIQAPKVTCSARILSRYLSVKASYADRSVSCSGVMPKGTAGKQLVGAISATAGGFQSSSSFSLSIDP